MLNLVKKDDQSVIKKTLLTNSNVCSSHLVCVARLHEQNLGDRSAFRPVGVYSFSSSSDGLDLCCRLSVCWPLCLGWSNSVTSQRNLIPSRLAELRMATPIGQCQAGELVPGGGCVAAWPGLHPVARLLFPSVLCCGFDLD